MSTRDECSGCIGSVRVPSSTALQAVCVPWTPQRFDVQQAVRKQPTVRSSAVSPNNHDVLDPTYKAAKATRPAQHTVPVVWPSAAADFVLLISVDDLPETPFKLNAWTEVHDAGKMLRCLRAEIVRGPGGPRSLYGALQRELLDLQQFAVNAAQNEHYDSYKLDD